MIQGGASAPELTPPTSSQLRRAALRMGRAEAPGADGLRTSDWAWRPMLHWDTLAQMVQVCEQRRVWPEHLRVAYVMLLSRGGLPVDKLQARPIAVLPMACR